MTKSPVETTLAVLKSLQSAGFSGFDQLTITTLGAAMLAQAGGMDTFLRLAREAYLAVQRLNPPRSVRWRGSSG